MTRHLTVLAISLFVLSGCGRTPAPAPEANEHAQPVASARPATEPAVDTTTCTFCAVPSSVRVCDVHEGIKTRLHWHVAKQGVQVVNFYVVDEAGAEQPFSQQGPEGEMDSGPWLRPGLTFRIKDDRNGEQLGEVVISGIDC